VSVPAAAEDSARTKLSAPHGHIASDLPGKGVSGTAATAASPALVGEKRASPEGHAPAASQTTTAVPLFRRLPVLGGILVVIVAAATAAYLHLRKPNVPQLTDKDQLILADFDNKTGDPVFDSTLKEALAIQLEQSPVIQLVSDAELHDSLQYLG